ncbi:NAD-dependent deacetylase [Mycolicibacterium thermoresistibile ATCC 19527]|uniref:NAD-dependent protein deacylase n=2 Tax=Mycolicibacterium thermoresistibile TaxID=1797 RepID=G7CGE4_MYCT3|nr:NAD-dependent deacetylase [Mycolicibacterium thermoresistibile ATCC 19527]GAT16116.1 NAD-dependent deacetylase [Mycolicibacterium thermoresistibile]SNW19608.1 silent information regulator protein Sir2 [Mycolicibacterium thermoresistibile]
MVTGAGMSAESGVPTFRDVETGLWAKVDPYEISSAEGWRKQPEKVWAWYLWRHYMMSEVKPNDGHRAVAAWEDYAHVDVVTQNVDNLHERAGSSRVYHVHGSLFEFHCDACRAPFEGNLPEMPEPVEAVDPPDCFCGGLIRPNVVWFGENLPEDVWQRSVGSVMNADVVIVVGTSAIVYPAAGLPELALTQGKPVIEVNPERTPLTENATVSLRETAARALPDLLQRLPELLD